MNRQFKRQLLYQRYTNTAKMNLHLKPFINSHLQATLHQLWICQLPRKPEPKILTPGMLIAILPRLLLLLVSYHCWGHRFAFVDLNVHYLCPQVKVAYVSLFQAEDTALVEIICSSYKLFTWNCTLPRTRKRCTITEATVVFHPQIIEPHEEYSVSLLYYYFAG